jgi:hypothetical protein
MFKVESNINDVIGRTQKIKRAIPLAMQEALAPELWLARARQVAQRTLLAIAQPEEQRFIQPFVNTVSADLLGAMLRLQMRSPFAGNSPDQVLDSARAAAAALTPKEIVATRGLSLFLQPVENFERLILEWVRGDLRDNSDGSQEPYPDELAKRKDARDWGKTDEEVARFISRLMLTPDPTDGERAAREKLEPHIAKFIANRLVEELNEAVAEVWLKAVLAAWRAMLRAVYPEQLHITLQRKTQG